MDDDVLQRWLELCLQLLIMQENIHNQVNMNYVVNLTSNEDVAPYIRSFKQNIVWGTRISDLPGSDNNTHEPLFPRVGEWWALSENRQTSVLWHSPSRCKCVTLINFQPVFFLALQNSPHPKVIVVFIGWGWIRVGRYSNEAWHPLWGLFLGFQPKKGRECGFSFPQKFEAETVVRAGQPDSD